MGSFDLFRDNAISDAEVSVNVEVAGRPKQQSPQVEVTLQIEGRAEQVGNSIEKVSPWLEKSLEFWLEIPTLMKKFKIV